MTIDLLLLFVGLAALVLGGDLLVRGAVAIAERARLSHLVIGLTIVAFGTSAPELLVSLTSTLDGTGGIALGNVVGSNIANIALILGVTAVIHAAPTSPQSLRVDMPMLLVSTGLLIWAASTGCIMRWHGIVGFLLLIAFTVWQIRHARRYASPQHAAEAETDTNGADTNTDNAEADASALTRWLRRYVWLAVLACVVALAALSYGADWLVAGASDLARRLGVSERIIGLSVVAVGTSLPELFASIMAARRGETDMAIGNIIGSNLFNILCVLGLTAVVAPLGDISPSFGYDFAWMFGLTIVLWIFLFTKHRLSRMEGLALLASYIIYMAHIVSTAA